MFQRILGLFLFYLGLLSESSYLLSNPLIKLYFILILHLGHRIFLGQWGYMLTVPHAWCGYPVIVVPSGSYGTLTEVLQYQL